MCYALRRHSVANTHRLGQDSLGRSKKSSGCRGHFGGISHIRRLASALSPILFVVVLDARRSLEAYALDAGLSGRRYDHDRRQGRLERHMLAWIDRLASFIYDIDMNEPNTVQVVGNDLSRTDFFKYLCSTLPADGSLDHEVVARATLHGRSCVC